MRESDHPEGRTDFSELATLPFADQLRQIDLAVASGEALPALLTALGALRDHEPLAHAVRALAGAAKLSETDVASALHGLLLELPDTGVQRLLRGLDRVDIPARQHQVVIDGVSQALQALPLRRLAAVCLMDRWLKNADTATQKRLCDEAFDACRKSLQDKDLEALEERVLLRVPGAQLASLDEVARSVGLADAWLTRRQRFADRVLELLEAMPKSLSQANAEELLSRRVYTHPGHFLVELLQNAEDAGARQWHVTIDDRQVCVWHDGVPFDAKDVVGVLSIGQTTKRREQIGFFGVGFKSVYEICERPQIYSDVFRFEVADVSIPRRLGLRPQGPPRDGTLLCLPLRNPDDPRRSPSVLHQRAMAVPAQTLLTLKNLQELRVSHGGSRRTARQESTRLPGRVRIVQTTEGEAPETAARQYLVAQREFAYEGPGREASKAGRTPVLVAVALDDGGCPEPLPADTPTVYSYLPTQERTGLRFMLHAHFDLPIDRERLDLASRWNVWAIAQAAELLAELAERLAAEAREARDDVGLDRLTALLDVLPLAEELSHPAFAEISRRLPDLVPDLRLLPGAAGELLSPATAAVGLNERLQPCLAGIDLDEAGRRLLTPLSPRARDVARALGAMDFGPVELVALLRRTLAEVSPGEPPPTPWLAQGLDAVLTVLAESREPVAGLERLPLLPDGEGRLWPPAALARADPELRAVYGSARPLVAAHLDDPRRPALAELLDRLHLPVLGPGELIRDLREPRLAAELLAGDGTVRLLYYLGRQTEDFAELARLPLFPDEAGVRWPLRADPTSGAPAVCLAPEGPLGDWLRKLTGTRPPLLDKELASRCGPQLRRFGARTLDLAELLRALERGELFLAAVDIPPLHDALDSIQEDLSRRMCLALRAAPIFPDMRGQLRPLEGPGRCLLPGDADIRRLAPDAPWLAAEVATLPYLRALDAAALGPAAVVRALLLEPLPGEELIDARRPDDLRRAYHYLIHHHEGISPSRIASLAAAPLWLDEQDIPRRLDELRRPSDSETLAHLYQAWAAHPMISDAEHHSALALTRALHLDGRLSRPDHRQLIDDLRAVDPQAAPRLVESGGDLRPLLLAALDETVESATPAQRSKLRDAPIFRAQSGEPLPLGDWDALDESNDRRCFRAQGVLREALAGGARPLLCVADDEELSAVLDQLAVRPAAVTDLVRAVEIDPALRTVAAARTVRQTLAGLREPLGKSFPPETRDNAPGNARLEGLAIWLTMGGSLRPASRVIRGASLEQMLGPDWAELLDEAARHRLLAPEAESEAAGLEGLVAFRPPTELLLERLKDVVPGAPLESQPPFVNTQEKLLRVVDVLRQGLEPEVLSHLPVLIDASGHLTHGPLFSATREEISLARGLPIHARLADPGWATPARALVPNLLPELPPRRLIADLAALSRDIRPVEEHPLLADPVRRETLYAWLLERRDEISADGQAFGPLAHASVIATRGGTLRAPGQLLLDPGLADVFTDWTPAQEVPPALVQWLRSSFLLADQQQDQLVEYLLEAHLEAVSEQDGPRSAELLGHLARALRVPADPDAAREALPRRYKLHRRLRVEADDGHFARPRTLLAMGAGTWELVTACCAQPPSRVSARYSDPQVLALIHAAGAKVGLTEAQLGPMLERGEGLRPGPRAALALARYVAELATREPALRQSLQLDRQAWIPDGTGKLRQPGELYWPEPEIVAVIGEDPARYPHPQFFLTTSDQVRQWLRFRRLDAARLEDVVDRLFRAADQGDVPTEISWWLEEGLRARRLRPGEIRDKLVEVRFLQDDDGVLRAPAELLRQQSDLFGFRRGTWSGFREHQRLADALGIPERAGRREVYSYLEEVGALAAELGLEELLAEEPELCQTLPRCLALLARLQADPPAQTPVAAADLSNAKERGATLCWMTDPALLLPEPASLARAARSAGVPIRIPLLSGDDADILGALARWGLKPLSSQWAPEPPPSKLPGDITEEHPEVTELLAALLTLQAALPRVRDQLRLPHDLWRDPMTLPREVRVVSQLWQEGKLAGAPVRYATSVLVDHERDRLVVTPAALVDRSEVAEALCRWLLRGSQDRTLVDRVTRVLEQEPLPEPSQERQRDERPPRTRPQALRTPERRAAEPTPPAPRPRPAAPAPTPRREAPPPSPEDDREERSLISRLRRWLKGEEREREAEREPEQTPEPSGKRRSPRRRPPTPHVGPQSDPSAGGDVSDTFRHGRWFRPRSSVRPQLEAAPDWLADRERVPYYGFAFSPSRLPLPYLYGPQLLAESFDARNQRWKTAGSDAAWQQAGSSGEARVAFQGRLPAGEVTLPMPLYGQLAELESAGPASTLETPDGQILLSLTAESELKYVVALNRAPDFTQPDGALPDVPSHLLAATVPDSELPPEALDLLAWIQGDEPALLERVQEIRSFVRSRYRYDPSYLEDPTVARWLRSVSRGRANAHIAALHAGRDANHLGRGVCYELNVLTCELLRRAGIPAGVATGWTFDRGSVTEPDHLWAMALLPSDLGPRWMPVDASTTREGRPLHAAHRPSGPWRARAPRHAKLPQAPDWAAAGSKKRRRANLPLTDLLRVAHHLEELTGEQLADEALRRRCRDLLADPVKAQALVELLRTPPD
ncbi:MAG: transglutaminase domain-containing protein [bacterium]